jgi:hypothetical protein
MPEIAIRFGVGDGVSRRAGTWRCWANHGGNDIYLLCRELRSALKTSLHASGHWRTAFEQKFLDANAIQEEWPSRVVMDWERPNGLAPGVTLAYRIVAPFAAVNTAIEPEDASGLVWIQPPPEGKAVETVVVITGPGVSTTNWPGKHSMNTSLVGRFELGNGDTVWLVTHLIMMPPGTVSLNRVRFFHGRGEADVKAPGLRAIVFGSEPDGSRVMYELVLAGEASTDRVKQP